MEIRKRVKKIMLCEKKENKNSVPIIKFSQRQNDGKKYRKRISGKSTKRATKEKPIYPKKKLRNNWRNHVRTTWKTTNVNPIKFRKPVSSMIGICCWYAAAAAVCVHIFIDSWYGGLHGGLCVRAFSSSLVWYYEIYGNHSLTHSLTMLYIEYNRLNILLWQSRIIFISANLRE